MSLKNAVKKTLDYMKKPVIRTEYVRTSAYPGLEGMFEGRNILVTGGTRGIGLAAAKAFHACGGTVIVTGRSPEKLREIQESFASDRFFAMEWDISDICGQEKKMGELDRIINGGVDVLVNNAGANRNERGETAASWDEVTEMEWNHIVNTNLKATYFLIQKFAKKWVEAFPDRERHVVNVASSSGFEPAVLPYGISKWGVVALTEGFGRKLAPYGITVNGVAPGPTSTTMATKRDDSEDLSYPEIPRQCYGAPEEIANAILFLASDYGKNIVGEVVRSDGGFSLTVTGGQ